MKRLKQAILRPVQKVKSTGAGEETILHYLCKQCLRSAPAFPNKAICKSFIKGNGLYVILPLAGITFHLLNLTLVIKTLNSLNKIQSLS